MATITTLLDKAKRAIADGESSLRKAAELIAQAQDEGAKQKQICKRLGKSRSWVTFLMAWRKGGYVGGAFDKSNKARKSSPTRQPKAPLRSTMTETEALAKRERIALEREIFALDTKRIPAGARMQLLLALKALSASHDSAAVLVERQRARLNLDWSDLIVPAEVGEAELSDAA